MSTSLFFILTYPASVIGVPQLLCQKVSEIPFLFILYFCDKYPCCQFVRKNILFWLTVSEGSAHGYSALSVWPVVRSLSW